MEKRNQDINTENDRHQRRSLEKGRDRPRTESPRPRSPLPSSREKQADLKFVALENKVSVMDHNLSRILRILDKPCPSTKTYDERLVRDPRKGKEPMDHSAESGTRSKGKKTDSMTSKVRGLRPTDRANLRSLEPSTLKDRDHTVSTPSYGHTKTDLRNLIEDKRRSAKTVEAEARAAKAEARAAKAKARAAEAEARLVEAEAKKDNPPRKIELLDTQKGLGNPQGDLWKSKDPGAQDLEELIDQVNQPFTEEVMEVEVPQKFKVPTFTPYDGKKDPVQHLNAYKSWMDFQGFSDAIRCRAFFFTLTGSAKHWFERLKRRSISSFNELARAFLAQFIGAREQRKPHINLLTVKQQPGESLRDYITRFNDEALQVEGYSEGAALVAITARLEDERLLNSIGKSQPRTYAEFVSRAQKYMGAEELLKSKKSEREHKRSSSSDHNSRKDKKPRTDERGRGRPDQGDYLKKFEK